MQVPEIKPLLSDMRKNKVNTEKFRFTFKNIHFEVIIFLDTTPFELLFGVINENLSFILNLRKGFYLDNIPDDVFFKLCEILNLKAGKSSFTSFMFLKHFASKIPTRYSHNIIQPHEVARHKTKDIPESEKIYFSGWKTYSPNSPYGAKNFKKTKAILGESAYHFCKSHNISSCWTDNPNKRRDYYKPQQYQKEKKQ